MAPSETNEERTAHEENKKLTVIEQISEERLKETRVRFGHERVRGPMAANDVDEVRFLTRTRRLLTCAEAGRAQKAYQIRSVLNQRS